MSTPHTCEGCEKELQVPPRYHDKDLKCPQCGHPFRIAGPADVVVPNADDRAELLKRGYRDLEEDDWVPTRPLTDLLVSPSRYFEDFVNFANYPVWPARIGYLASAMLSAVPTLAYYVPLSTPRVVVYAAVQAIPGAALTAVLFGIIIAHVGARMMGGRGSLSHTVGGIGLALFWPSVIGLGLTMLGLLSDGVRPQLPTSQIDILRGLENGPALSPYLFPMVILQLVAGLWAFVLEIIAVSRIHRISLFRALVALVWLTLLIAAFVGLAFVLPEYLARRIA